MLDAAIDEIAHAPLWRAVLEIVFVNLLLSGDNAVVIAMACRALPRRERILGLLIGQGVAVVLLIVFAGVMSRLLQLPYIKIAGGLALIYIAARLVLPQEPESEVEAAANLWRAVRILIVADFVMSFDNILAIVQIARGSLVLLAIGLAVSIPVVIVGATIGMALLERLPILAWAGAAFLGWVAGQTIVADDAIARAVLRAAGGQSSRVELASGCAGVILVIAFGTLWRHCRTAGSRPRQQR
jgi:YjbE family integral membrane protein